MAVTAFQLRNAVWTDVRGYLVASQNAMPAKHWARGPTFGIRPERGRDGTDGRDGRTGRTDGRTDGTDGRADGRDGRTEYSFTVLLGRKNTVLQY